MARMTRFTLVQHFLAAKVSSMDKKTYNYLHLWLRIFIITIYPIKDVYQNLCIKMFISNSLKKKRRSKQFKQTDWLNTSYNRMPCSHQKPISQKVDLGHVCCVSQSGKKERKQVSKALPKKKKIIHVWLTKIHIFYFYLYFLLHVQ